MFKNLKTLFAAALTLGVVGAATSCAPAPLTMEKVFADVHLALTGEEATEADIDKEEGVWSSHYMYDWDIATTGDMAELLATFDEFEAVLPKYLSVEAQAPTQNQFQDGTPVGFAVYTTEDEAFALQLVDFHYEYQGYNLICYQFSVFGVTE